MEALQIHLFGGFLLVRNGVALPPIASRAGRSLFAHLVMHRDRPQQRDLLTGAFWPDLPESKARRRLSQTLWQIQDVVNQGSESHLSVTTDTLAFDTSVPYWLDVEEFDRNFDLSAIATPGRPSERRVDSQALRKCIELYRGDLLAGFFEDWVAADQDYYRLRYVLALNRLVDATKADGAYEDALTHARRLTHHDPLSEATHQEVMRLCFLLGRTSEALEQFERCRLIMAEELNSEPSRETIELYERIVRQRNSGIRPAHGGERALPLNARGAAPFVGREEERGDLVDSLEQVLGGPGGVVLVEGEPGVGKTRLATEVADDAAWRGFEVSWGNCKPGALRPFGPLVEVLESLSQLRVEQLANQVAPVWLNESLRLAPRFGDSIDGAAASTPLRPTEESTRMKEAIVHTLGGLGKITPHLVIIDDVQWADSDTLSVLTQMGPRLAESRILLLLLYRSEEARGDPEAWDVLRALDRSAGLRRVVLSPLSVFELDDMVKRILDVARLEPKIASQLHRRTGGNALFALETLLAMRDQGVFEVGDPSEVLLSQLSGQTLPVAPRVRSVIDSRMSLLGETASVVCEVAAVCGDPADLSLLSAGSDLPRATVVGGVDELLQRGLLSDNGESEYQITHDQVRQVVYERVDVDRRAVIHIRIARELQAVEPVDVEAVGYHFRQGGDHVEAAPYLYRAGLNAVGVSAYATAIQHLELAWSTASDADWSEGERYDLLAQLEAAQNVLGRRSDGLASLEEMAKIAATLPEFEGDVQRRRAWLYAHTADFINAELAAVESVEVERRTGDSPALAASLVALGTTLRWSGRPLEAVPHLKEAVLVATEDLATRADALTELASTLVEVQLSVEAHPYLAEALIVYEQLGDLRGEAEVAGIQGRAFHQQGERDQARARYERAIDLCQRVGYRHGEGVNLVNLSLLHHMLGRVADALPGYDQAEKVFSDLGNIRGKAMVLANGASARHSLLGDDERALADAKKAKRHFTDIGDDARVAQCLEIMAGVALRQGNEQEADRMLEESISILEGSGNLFLEGQHLRSLSLLRLEQDQASRALEVLDRADQVCAEANFAALEVELLSIRAMAMLSMGKAREASDASRRAVENLVPGVERPYLVLQRRALAAKSAGEHDEARRASLRALEVLETALSGLSAESRKSALERVPEHAEIVAAGQRLTPHTITVQLPAVRAPVGRSLDANELRQVTWTIDHPDDDKLASPIARRHQRILRLLAEAREGGASPSIELIADALGVSESTVRRDLDALAKSGHDVTTRGKRHRAS